MDSLPNAAKVHDKFGTIYRKLGNLRLLCGGKFFFFLAAYHFSRAYIYYLRQGNNEAALEAYEGLKQTKFKNL
jgi:hypothetical protein